MKKSDMSLAIEAAKELGCQMGYCEEDNNFKFLFFTPHAQDYSFQISLSNIKSLKDLSKALVEQYHRIDLSYETYMRVNDSGHGVNGAPHDLREVYNDMETVEAMLWLLGNKLDKLDKE